ncbi:MAG: phage tail protein [Candidatus Marinimicrobia bacterium]|nr:phage tail protein [Candidatus Neomarinimicrobiota bacterium]
MTKHRLELFDRSDSARRSIFPTADLIYAKRVDELNGINTLSIGITLSSELWSSINPLEVIRVVNLDDESYESFRIRQKLELRRGNNSPEGRLECEHLKYDMLDEVYPKWTPYAQAEPSTVINEILGESSFSVGTISPATKLDLVLSYNSVLDLLNVVRERLGTDLIVNNDKTVSIKRRGSLKEARIRYARNLKGIRRNIDTRELFNVVYPVGGGEPPADIGGNAVLGTEAAEHIIFSISGATLSSHQRLVPSDDSWNNYYMEITRALGSATIGARRLITDSIAGGQLVVTTVFSGLSVGDYFKIVADASGSDIKQIRDAGSIDSFGRIESTYFNRSRVEARNLLFNTDFSGNYSSGIADNWSVVTLGAAFPVTENINTDFIKYGSKSQLITEADPGEGMKQSVTLEVDSVYSLYVWVYVSQGNVKLELYDGVADQPSNSGKTAQTSLTGVWTQLMVEGITAQGTGGIVKILSNSIDTDFYIDSVILEKSTKLSVPNEFYPISGARILWDEGFDALQSAKNKKVKYTVSAIDLYEADPDGYPYDKLEVGDTITLQDDELGIDIRARIRSKRWNLLEPWSAELEIDNFTDRLPRIFKKENKNRNDTATYISNLMGRRVNDRQLEETALIVNVRENPQIQ